MVSTAKLLLSSTHESVVSWVFQKQYLRRSARCHQTCQNSMPLPPTRRRWEPTRSSRSTTRSATVTSSTAICSTRASSSTVCRSCQFVSRPLVQNWRTLHFRARVLHVELDIRNEEISLDRFLRRVAPAARQLVCEILLQAYVYLSRCQ